MERNNTSLLILATRPARQNKSWAELLQRAGFRVQEQPLLAIQPVTELSKQEQIKSKILSLDDYSKLIFVSQNAVKFGFEWIDQYWPQFPVGIKCYGVGKKTAGLIGELLAEYSVSIEFADQAMTSEELIALPSLENIEHQKILLFRGVGGRTKIQEALTARGAVVEHCELYSRLPLKVDFKRLDCPSEDIVVPVFSGETLQNLFQQVKETLVGWNTISLVVPGERVARQAEKMGFKYITQAQNASEEAMMEALQNTKRVKINE